MSIFAGSSRRCSKNAVVEAPKIGPCKERGSPIDLRERVAAWEEKALVQKRKVNTIWNDRDNLFIIFLSNLHARSSALRGEVATFRWKVGALFSRRNYIAKMVCPQYENPRGLRSLAAVSLTSSTHKELGNKCPSAMGVSNGDLSFMKRTESRHPLLPSFRVIVASSGR